MAIKSYICKRLFCTGSHRTLGKSQKSTRPSLQFRSSKRGGSGKSRREFSSSKLTRPPSRGQIPACELTLSAVGPGCDRCTPGWWLCSFVNSLGFAPARLVGRPVGSPDRTGRFGASCVARLGDVRAGRLVLSSRFGFELAGVAGRLCRSRGRFLVPSMFSIQTLVWELGGGFRN